MGKLIVEGVTKKEVANKVTDLVLNRGWEAVGKITLEESNMHNAVAKYKCVVERKGKK